MTQIGHPRRTGTPGAPRDPAVFGVFVVYTGYPAAFALTGMLMLAALVPAIRDRAASRTGGRRAPAPQDGPTGPSTSS